MNHFALRFIARCVKRLPTPRLVIDLGGCDVNGSPRRLFGYPTRYVGVDIRPGNGVDVVADAAEYVSEEPADMVICTSLLEHCRYPERVIENARRMLRPGGVLILTTPTPAWPPHGVDGGALEDEYYRQIIETDVCAWLGCFGQWALEQSGDNQFLAVAQK